MDPYLQALRFNTDNRETYEEIVESSDVQKGPFR